jgi:hypothetical protein
VGILDRKRRERGEEERNRQTERNSHENPIIPG